MGGVRDGQRRGVDGFGWALNGFGWASMCLDRHGWGWMGLDGVGVG